MFEENRASRYKVGKEDKNQIWILDPDNHPFYKESRNINLLLTGEDTEIQTG